MPEAHQADDEGRPHEPVDAAEGEPDQHEPGDGELRDEGVAAAEQRVDDVAAVELARGDEVQGGDEEPEPRRDAHRVKQDVEVGRQGAERQPLEELRQHGVAELDVGALGRPRGIRTTDDSLRPST